MTIQIVTPRERVHGDYGGAHYGAWMNALIKGADVMLVHVPGQKGWHGMTGHRYSQPYVAIVRECHPGTNIRRQDFQTTLVEGERLSKALLAREDVRAAVVKQFGQEAADAMSVKHTVVIS